MNPIHIDVGTYPNDGMGAPLRTAFQETNDNFDRIFEVAQPAPPATLYGKAGDLAGWYAYSSSYFYYCFEAYTDGTLPIWGELEPLGNISAIQLVNGSSSVVIQSPGANVNVTVAGLANVGQFNTGGLNVIGAVSTTGNITGLNMVSQLDITAVGNIVGGHLYGNGYFITDIATTYTDANVAHFLPTYTGNLASGNLSVAYTASVAGNISASYFIGNGSQLTGLPLNYSNANVAAFLPTYTGALSGNSLNIDGNSVINGSISTNGNVDVNYQSRINGTLNGQMIGLVNNINTAYGTWDFGAIATNTYTNPTQWIFAQTPAGNVNMGTILSPTALSIDIGTIF
jgi:hypothetical protein